MRLGKIWSISTFPESFGLSNRPQFLISLFPVVFVFCNSQIYTFRRCSKEWQNSELGKLPENNNAVVKWWLSHLPELKTNIKTKQHTQKTLSFTLFSFKKMLVISTENKRLLLLVSFFNWTQRRTYNLGGLNKMLYCWRSDDRDFPPLLNIAAMKLWRESKSPNLGPRARH